MSDLLPPAPLDDHHNVDPFDSGKRPLDDFLKLHARDKQRAMLSRTYVVATKDHVVVACYTLALIFVSPAEPPRKLGRGMPRQIPAMLLARLAVDTAFQGRGLGRSLFVDAVKRTWTVMKSGAAPVRFLVVDAIDQEARAFYERFDMVPAPENPLRLFTSYKSLQSLFEPDK